MATKTNPIKPELIDELLSGRDPKTLFESEGLLDELKKALAERVLNAERQRQARAVHSARSARSVRPAAHRQVPAPLPRLRPEGHCLVRPRHEHARDPGASA